jgi:hypothetical protein
MKRQFIYLFILAVFRINREYFDEGYRKILTEG